MKKSIFLFFAAILCATSAWAATWTVAGSDTKILNGTSTWAPSDTKNDMTQVSGTTYWGLLLTDRSLSKTTYTFKVCKDHGWGTAYPGSNYELKVDPAGTYNLAYSFNTSGNAVKATLFKTWTVAGSSAALGSDWKPEDANNDMTRDGSTFDYKLTKTNVNLKKGTTYECKVVKDHAWGEAYPGNNKTYTVDADGYYNVTFSFNVVTKAVTVTTTLIKNTVTASANPAEGGFVNGAGEYAKGSNVTLTATPATGYEFVNWTEGESVVSTSTQYNFALLSDVNLVANFKIPVPDAVKYQVNVSANDNVMGIVTGGGEYEENATAILNATPNAGYQFVNWTVGGEEKSTNTTYSFIVTEAVEVVANFKEIPTETVYLVNNSDWTKVYAYGWDGTKGETPAWPGAEITANKLAEKYEGYDVYSYKVEEGSYGKVIFNNGSGKQTATFDWENGKYYYAVDPLGSNVFLAGDMNEWNGSADELKKETVEGTTASIKVNLTAKTYEFKLVIDGAWKANTGTMQRGGQSVHEGGWSFDKDGYDDKCKLVADIAGDYIFTWDLNTKKLTVTYPALPKHQVTATVNPAETGEVTGTGEYEQGSTATLVAVPAANYAFKNWTEGGEEVSTEATYSFKVTKAVELVANFVSEVTHEVTVSYLCGGTPILGHDAHTLAVGVTTPSTITAPAITDYTFSGWELGSGVTSTDDPSASSINIKTLSTGDYTLTANYTKIELTYTVTVPAGTEKCYIAGEMTTEWSFVEMTKVDDTHFTITIEGATADDKYKYAAGPDWAYVEKKADGSEAGDRTYNANDVVKKWASVYDPSATYVLMGVNGDWDNGIALEVNPHNAAEYRLLCQPIVKANDAIKVVKISKGNKSYCANIADGSIATEYDGNGNIVLADGIYDFYYKIHEDKIYIATATNCYTRDVTEGKYGTICLPKAATNCNGATFFEVAGKEGDKVFFDEVTTLEAGVPYVFLAESNKIVLSQTGESADEAGKSKSLQGTFTQIDPADDNILVGNYMVVNNVIKKCGIKCGLKENRAYFIATDLENLGTPSARVPGRRRVAIGQAPQVATGIDQVQGDNVPTKMIINGQLFILRGEKMYDAQGKLVK